MWGVGAAGKGIASTKVEWHGVFFIISSCCRGSLNYNFCFIRLYLCIGVGSATDGRTTTCEAYEILTFIAGSGDGLRYCCVI